MRVRALSDADQFRELIGEQNYLGIQRALADSAEVWIFRSEEEIQNEVDLNNHEKEGCLKIYREQKLGYVGWIRPLPRPRDEAHLFAPVYGHDAHGNYRGGGGSGNSSPH